MDMRIRREAVYLQLSHKEASDLRQLLASDGKNPHSREMWEQLMDHKAWLLLNSITPEAALAHA